MYIERVIANRNITKYRLSMLSNVPQATLNDICSGKTKIDKCSAFTVYKLSKALNIPMEKLYEECVREYTVVSEREKSYEYGLPEYLQHDLDEYKKALNEGSSLMDCLLGRTLCEY